MGMVHDAQTAAAAARVNELLRQCDEILKYHIGRADRRVYGVGDWAKALSWDLSAMRARLARVRDEIAGCSGDFEPGANLAKN